MMNVKSFFLFLVVGSTFNCFSQNLVPNGSFEEFSECPYALDQVDFCNDWVSSLGSCDYYNACKIGDLGGVGVPQNFAGIHNAENGSAYMGLVTYHESDDNYREILGVELISSLLPNELYYFSFRFVRGNGIPMERAASGLGIKFGNNPNIDSNSIDNLPFAHIDTIHTDANNWNLLVGTIQPEMEITHLFIGNFLDDQSTLTVSYDDFYDTNAYYLIDNVRLSTDSDFVYQPIPHLAKSNVHLKVWPTVARNFVVLNSLQPLNQIEVYDQNGQKVIHIQKYNDSKMELNIEELKTGLYNIISRQENGIIQTGRFIKII